LALVREKVIGSIIKNLIVVAVSSLIPVRGQIFGFFKHSYPSLKKIG